MKKADQLAVNPLTARIEANGVKEIENIHYSDYAQALNLWVQPPTMIRGGEVMDRKDFPTQPFPESDPNGFKPGEAGAKLDAGKIPVGRGALQYFPRAIRAIAELSALGAEKYSWKGWEKVPDGINRYTDALGRHELGIEGDYTRRDPANPRVLEATAVAWNACARLELIIRAIDAGRNPNEPNK